MLKLSLKGGQWLAVQLKHGCLHLPHRSGLRPRLPRAPGTPGPMEGLVLPGRPRWSSRPPWLHTAAAWHTWPPPGHFPLRFCHKTTSNPSETKGCMLLSGGAGVLRRWVRPQKMPMKELSRASCGELSHFQDHPGQVRGSAMSIFIIMTAFNKKLIPPLSCSTNQQQDIIHAIANFGHFFSEFGWDGALTSDQFCSDVSPTFLHVNCSFSDTVLPFQVCHCAIPPPRRLLFFG